jgi:hypothetical protein
MKAREVYNDCLYAKQCIKRAIDQGKLEDAKLFWFAAITMLRTIAHVLDKVDRKARGAHFSNEIDRRWQLWKELPIFRDFIELERNNIVKEYESSLADKEILEDGSLLTEDGGELLTEDGNLILITTTITTLVKSRGKFPGSAPDVALSRALAWWDKELADLENIP